MLAVRLFANMLAGHTALVVVLSFIMMAGQAAAARFFSGGDVFLARSTLSAAS